METGQSAAKGRTLHGRITEIWPQEGYGRVRAEDREFLFDRSDVVQGGFAFLVVGADVSFLPEDAPDMPRAREVRISGS